MTHVLPRPARLSLRSARPRRAHACFELRDDGWWIHDNASTNGTWVEGKRVTSSRVVGGNRVTSGLHGAEAPDLRGVTFEFHEP